MGDCSLTSSRTLWGSFSGELDRSNPPNAIAGASYQTSNNRWLLLALAEEDKNWPVFANAVGRADWMKDARFIDSKSRHKNAGQLVAELDRLFGAQSLVYWKKVLDDARLPDGLVQIPEEIIKNPQLLANQIIIPINDGSAKQKYTVNSPVTIKEESKVAPRFAPALGEHTDQVLQEIGYDKSAIEAFKKNGVISDNKKPT